jgi:hypothetical protein
MKKIFIILLLFVSVQSFAQTGLIRYLQGSAPTFTRYVDTLKSLNLATPLYKLNDSTIALDTSNFWGIRGNAGITAGSSFFGTRDSKSVYFKTNGVIRALMDSTGKFFIDSMYIGKGAGLGVNYGNTAIGIKALLKNTVGEDNTAIGDSALSENTTGTQNTAVGYKALSSNKTGNVNTAVGFGALLADTSGQGLVAVGHTALVANTSGSHNTGVGYKALFRNTTGGDNTATGESALASVVTASDNTANGFNALTNSTGSYNTALGASAGAGLTSGSQNTTVGTFSLLTSTSAGSNTAVGYGALAGTTAGGNIALGNSAGQNNTSGANQLFISMFLHGSYSQEQNKSLIYSQGNTTTTSQITTINGALGVNKIAPTGLLHISRGTTIASSAPIKIDGPISLATTAATGNSTNATLTFATTTNPPFVVGSTIVIAGVTPAGYNGSYPVVSVTATTVTYGNTTTGAQTVAGTITQGAVLATPENGTIEYDGVNYFATEGGVRYILTRTLTGTAAPATTPTAIGEIFVDYTNKKMYVATGTASSADWTILN